MRPSQRNCSVKYVLLTSTFIQKMALPFPSIALGLLALLHFSTSSRLVNFLVYTLWVSTISVTYGLVPRRRKEPLYICNTNGVDSFYFIYLLFITIYGLRKTRPKDELQKSQRPHIKADHLRY